MRVFTLLQESSIMMTMMTTVMVLVKIVMVIVMVEPPSIFRPSHFTLLYRSYRAPFTN